MASQTAPNGFFVYRGAHLEALAAQLAERLKAAPPADPMEPIVIAVGSRGMERWLRHRLAGPLGITANLAFPFPGQAIGAVFGADAEATLAWSPDALAWRVLECLPTLLHAPEFAPLARWLARESGAEAEGSVVGRDRWALAREVADVLDRASLFRPEWVAAWESGAAIAIAAGPPEWQRVLWGAVRTRVPAELVHPTQRMRCPPTEGGAVHVFGVSSMPPAWVEALNLASAVRPVHLYHLTPSAEYWGDLKVAAELRRMGDAHQAEMQRVTQNPVLTTLGRLARDSIESLLAYPILDIDVDQAFPQEDEPGENTVLSTLQQDVATARSLTEIRALAPTRVLRQEDDSVRLHACHGPTRQVEVLREALLDLFDRHRHLQPRHVVVMTPDLGTYAPLVRAVFSEGFGHRADCDWGPVGGPAIPTSIADLGLQELNPLANLLVRALELVDGRLTGSALVEFAGLAPVRRRFGFTDAALAQIRVWMAEAGARLGANAEERVRLGLPDQHVFTLAFALDRLALGVAMHDEHGASFHGAAPYDEMEGSSVEDLGAFAELCARLERWRTDLRTPRTVSAWCDALLEMVDALGEVSTKATFLRTELVEGLDAWKAEAAGYAIPVAVGALAPMLTARFERGRSGDRPATGAVTVCAMTPMRSVPFRVVCLLGMDDGAFPRSASARAFDAAASNPRAGDRDPREEDRNLLLEAVMAAREHLVICYTGRDGRSGKTLAPAVPVGDLLDAIDATISLPPLEPPLPEGKTDSRRTRDALTYVHAVQPFSASGFAQPAAWPAAPRFRRFDRRMYEAAQALSGARAGAAPFLSLANVFPESEPVTQVSVAELVEWLRKPVRTLIKRRFGLSLKDYTTDVQDRESLTPDGLDRWKLGNAVIEAYRSGLRAEAAVHERLLARAVVPPGAPGHVQVLAAWEKVGWVAADLDRCEQVERHAIDVRVGGVRVVDTLTTHGGRVLRVGLGKPDRAADQLEVWITLVALRAAVGSGVTAGEIVGVNEEDGVRVASVFTPPEDAPAELARLVELWQLARTRALPLVEKSSQAFAKALLSKPDDTAAALKAADGQWRTTTSRPGEDDDPALRLVFGEGGAHRAPSGDPAAFRDYAQALWRPILSAQRSDA